MVHYRTGTSNLAPWLERLVATVFEERNIVADVWENRYDEEDSSVDREVESKIGSDLYKLMLEVVFLASECDFCALRYLMETYETCKLPFAVYLGKNHRAFLIEGHHINNAVLWGSGKGERKICLYGSYIRYPNPLFVWIELREPPVRPPRNYTCTLELLKEAVNTLLSKQFDYTRWDTCTLLWGKDAAITFKDIVGVQPTPGGQQWVSALAYCENLRE